MRKYTLILLFLLIATVVMAHQYAPDIIVTSPAGLWTDTRAYTSLANALTAIGGNERNLYIVRQEDYTGTIPATASLNFMRVGSINATGAVTLNSKSIIAGNRRIFFGAGALTFADGSVLKSAWFDDIDEAIAETNTDTVTILMTQAETAATTAALGNDVTLKWDAPGNALSINNGRIISNISSIIAGDYEIITGAGRADFVDGSTIWSTWFDQLRTAGRHIDDSVVVLQVRKTETLDYDYTFARTTTLDFAALITIAAGRTLTIYSTDNVRARNRQHIFSVTATGAIAFTFGGVASIGWFGGIGDGVAAGDNTTYTGTDNLAFFDATIASLINGGTVQFPEGTYLFSDELNIYMAGLASNEKITLRGTNNRNTSIICDDDTGAACIHYDNAGGGGHIVNIEELFIHHTAAFVAEESWHPGIGILIDSGRSHIDNVNILAFTSGLYVDGGSYSYIRNSRINRSQKGITFDTVAVPILIERSECPDCGDINTPANGWAIKLIKTAGKIIASEWASSPSPGLILEGSHGVDITGNNIETYQNSRSIIIRGHQTDTDYADIRNWSAGINISGNRFWNALGIRFDEGAGWVEISSNTWINNTPEAAQQEGNVSFGVHETATDNLTLRHINYTSSNNWLHGVEPTLHNTHNLAHAFTLDGISIASVIPAVGTFETGRQIINRTNPSFRWVFEDAGTFGVLNAGATTGTIATLVVPGDQRITLNSTTGIYPGSRVTIAGAGVAAANLDVIVGGVEGTVVSFFPAASTTVAGAAVSYTAPKYHPEGQDIRVQTVADAATVTIDLSDGGYIIIGLLAQNTKLMNPTNGIPGQHFYVKMVADGTNRDITYDTWFGALNKTITANKTIVYHFVLVTSTAIHQVGTPVEF